MKICVAGACGRMGRRIIEMASAWDGITVGGAFDAPGHAGMSIPCGGGSVVAGADPEAELERSEVLIDFTVAEACLNHAQMAAALGKPCVIGTTGLTPDQRSGLAAVAERVAVVYAPNMSVGVNLLFKLTQETAARLGLDYNVEIIEMHHNQKKDSPSGTAVRLAECAAEGLGLTYPDQAVHGRHGLVGARPLAEIGVHAVRGGDVVGEHTVVFAGAGERIELVHKAHNRDNFARGALIAAQYVLKQPSGLYDMQDVLGLR